MGINDEAYLDRPEQWDELAVRCRKAGIIGLDTEFYGVDVRKQSCVGRARVHVWSVAIRTKRLDPLGYHRARGWLLPAEALTHPSIREMLEDAAVRKAIHNQSVDDHSIHNHGVKLRGAINTLDLARWAWPELVTAGGFGLKSLMQSRLHMDPVCEYLDVVRYVRREVTQKYKEKKVNFCQTCSGIGCRKRKGHDKTPMVQVSLEQIERDVKDEYPLESIVPGHERWDLLVPYGITDAVAALQIEELCRGEQDPAPWPYTADEDDRPTYCQEVTDEVVLMERVGFNVDTEYSAKQLATAEADELTELRWLRKWLRKNVTDDSFVIETGIDPLFDNEADAIWSSNQQLVEVFDYFGFPRSPVWKKGKVKPGDVKMDGAALEWIAKNHAPAKQLIDHVLQLKKIRSQKKYFLKLRDCGGYVNPICGPAGDADDRNGAVTGRLGIKGVLEAQQLPQKKEVDLYQVRRAIVA